MIEPRNPARPGILAWGLALGGIVLFSTLMLSQARADEIRFRSRDGILTGTVLEEGGGTVTIRFPRETIESITRAAGSREEEPKPEPVLTLEERIRKLESKVDSLPPAGPPTAGGGETGGVEGVIRWKNRPLSHGRVMIVPAKTAGMSPAPPEREPPGGAEGAPGGRRGDRYETETDEGGRYHFDRVPPGEYLIYWKPDDETGWVRRLREKPDLAVVRGDVTVLNIPAEKK